MWGKYGGRVNGVRAAPRGSDTSGPATGACEAAEGWLGRGRRRWRFAGGTRLLRENMAEAEPTPPLPAGERSRANAAPVLALFPLPILPSSPR